MPPAAKDILACTALTALVLWYAQGWLGDGLPPLDFPGTVANVDVAARAPLSAAASQWNDQWFCGMPSTTLTANMLWIASFLPFTRGFDSVSAVKLGCLFYFCMASIGTYFFLRAGLGRRLPALIGAAVFPLHPVAVATAVSTGHANFAPLYAITPFVFLAALACARNPSLGKYLWLATLDAILLWVDNERGVITSMFVMAFFLAVSYHSVRRRQLDEGVAAAAVSAAWRGTVFMGLTSWAVAAIAVPAYVSSKNLSLFTEAEKLDTISLYGLNNPLYLLDRGQEILTAAVPILPDNLASNSGRLYVGSTALIAAVAAALAARKSTLRLVAWFALASAIAAVWLSVGTMPLYYGAAASLDQVLKVSPTALTRNPWFAAQLVLMVALLAVSAFLLTRMRWLRSRPARMIPLLYVLPAAGCAVCFLAPFMWLRRVPLVFGQMRSPTWFMSCILPFALASGAGAFVAVLSGRIRRHALRKLAAFTVLAVLLADFYPYRHEFHLYHRPEIEKAAQEVSGFLSHSESQGRVLSAASYSPLNDMVIAASGRANAWGWLNWAAPRGAKDYVFTQVYHELRANQIRAAALAGIANIRYIVSYAPEDHFQSEFPLLHKVMASNAFTVYENSACRPFIQAYDVAAAGWKVAGGPVPALVKDATTTLAAREPTRIRVNTLARRPLLLVVSESLFPGWSCLVDGSEVKVAAFGGAFLCAQIPPGNHLAEFSYGAPRSYFVSYAVSGAYVLFALSSPVVIVWKRWLKRKGSREIPANGA